MKKISKEKISEAQVHQAILTILSDTDKYSTSLNYAVNYCLAARGMSGEELRIQCLYILNNIVYWRHSKAREVRKLLRQFTRS